jgi:streptomycin 6-kinase
MQLPPLPDETAALLTARLGDRAESWFGMCENRTRRALGRWRLEPDGAPLGGGSWAYLLPCRTADGREAVLKVSAALPAVRREASALRRWRGVPAAVELLGAALRDGVLLLERIRPGSSFRGDEPAAGEALATALRALHGVPAKEARLGALAADVRDVLRRVAVRLEWRARRRDVARVLTLADQLLTSSDPAADCLLHADLSPGNVLTRSSGLVAIDPGGVAGEREYDVASCAVYFPFLPTVEQRVAWLAAELSVDAERTLAWSRIHALQSASYALAFRGSDDWVEERLAFAFGH